ncbi:glycosyltransferase family 4 protein [Patescibacteria group bacterium]|nr:glycosyltransferase family 4 protein [Patescibacteria group bacterium]MBU1721680.1 glycosyltransferase family 4 protein [Patescibacteria group bacterium]MBU1900989.1 glycosyltransferase family 4 protein [Patescibacteria group bacterium]
MHIAIDLRPWMGEYKTGVGQYIEGLLDSLFSLETQHIFTLFTSGKQQVKFPKKWQKYTHVQSVHLPMSNKFLHFCLYLLHYPRLDQYVSKKTGSVVDVWFSPNMHFTPLSLDVRHIMTIHDLSFLLYPKFFTKKQQLWHKLVNAKRQARLADQVIVPSYNTKQDVVDYYHFSEEKVSVIYPGVTAIEKSEVIEHLPQKYMVYVGTCEPRKNIRGIIHAYVKSHAHDMGYDLVLAGAPGWKCKDVQAMVQYTPGVHALGYISAEQKRFLYEHATLALFPSFYEGFGFPPVEAAYYHCPVITSNSSSLPEVMGGAAYYVDPYHIDTIADGIGHMLTSSDLRERFCVLDKKQVELFQWESSAKQFLSLINNIL